MKVIRPHSASWKNVFAMVSRDVRAQLGETALRVEHIGSTAVPEIFAKPIIDIALEVVSLSELDAKLTLMEAIGFEARGEHGIPDRRYFKKPVDASGVGVHVHSFARGSAHIARHIYFRDYLLAEPKVAQQYSALKQSLADGAGVLVDDYVERKSGLVAQIQRLAFERFTRTS